MLENETPQEPASEREDKHSELYGTREYPPHLQSPQRLAQTDDELIGRWPRCSACDGRLTWVNEADGGYWRHMDLVDLGEPHRATTDVLGEGFRNLARAVAGAEDDDQALAMMRAATGLTITDVDADRETLRQRVEDHRGTRACGCRTEQGTFMPCADHVEQL